MPLVVLSKGVEAVVRCLACALILLASSAGLLAQHEADPLTRARQAYNLRQFDRAVVLAEEARKTPGQVNSASLILSRSLLERFRRSGDAADVASARQALLSVDASHLSGTEPSELHLGMAELLFVDEQFGAATELFEIALDRPGMVSAAQRELVLEWWAASLDRYAQLAPDSLRPIRYGRMLTRLEREAGRGAASPVVAYWMVAAARGVDDLDRAWSLAIAGWIQAPAVAGVRAEALRADLDHLMVDAIIPERARHITSSADPEALEVALTLEWKAIKEKWSRSSDAGGRPWWPPCQPVDRRRSDS